eukprot:13119879-Alexandrium_andersonii.AAC.1
MAARSLASEAVRALVKEFANDGSPALVHRALGRVRGVPRDHEPFADGAPGLVRPLDEEPPRLVGDLLGEGALNKPAYGVRDEACVHDEQGGRPPDLGQHVDDEDLARLGRLARPRNDGGLVLGVVGAEEEAGARPRQDGVLSIDCRAVGGSKEPPAPLNLSEVGLVVVALGQLGDPALRRQVVRLLVRQLDRLLVVQEDAAVRRAGRPRCLLALGELLQGRGSDSSPPRAAPVDVEHVLLSLRAVPAEGAGILAEARALEPLLGVLAARDDDRQVAPRGRAQGPGGPTRPQEDRGSEDVDARVLLLDSAQVVALGGDLDQQPLLLRCPGLVPEPACLALEPGDWPAPLANH